jgi:6,7-dimethyl-8-ribityllumazine synthase
LGRGAVVLDAFDIPQLKRGPRSVPRVFEGKLTAPRGSFGIVVSRYNESITGKLLTGALDTLVENGVADASIDVAWVPGAFEIPLVADRMAKSGRYVAVICLGAVIRGETTHDQHINRAVSVALGEAGLHSGVPVLFGVLTCDTLEQAIHRAGGRVGNKGSECALAALEMVNLLAKLA